MALKDIDIPEPIKLKFHNSFDIFDDEKLFQLCVDNPNMKIERSQEGELIVMLPVGMEGSSKENIVSGELYLWNKEKKAGVAFNSNAGFTLPNRAMRSPDAAFVFKESWKKLPIEERKKFGHICPEFVVEVRSESDSLIVLKDKMLEWIENGANLAWLIDPIEEKAYIYRPNNDIEIINSFNESISGESVLPDFQLDLSLLNEEI